MTSGTQSIVSQRKVAGTGGETLFTGEQVQVLPRPMFTGLKLTLLAFRCLLKNSRLNRQMKIVETVIRYFMRETIALWAGVSIAIFALYLAVSKRLDWKFVCFLLLFALVSGLVIANYDVLKRLKWKGLEFEAFERRVETVTSEAINGLEAKTQEHKEAIQLLIRTSNETAENLMQQKTNLQEVIETAKRLEVSLDT